LLLDDDIDPDENLLLAYANAIGGHPDAIGFATLFLPQTFQCRYIGTKDQWLNRSFFCCFPYSISILGSHSKRNAESIQDG
jgi:hypothetical protein